MTPHLLFAISPHGFGHAAMVASVINTLREHYPAWRFTLRTTVAPEFLNSRIKQPYEMQRVADDFGMVQLNALEVDVEASARRYRAVHRNWDEAVERVAEELRVARVDLV